MDILVAADYKDVLQYQGKVIETKHMGKKARVFFKLFCDDFNLRDALRFAEDTPTVAVLVYQGTGDCQAYKELQEVGKVPVVLLEEVGCDITESDICRALEGVPKGVTLVFSVPDGYVDLKFVYNMCMKYSNIRFYGGDLFRVPGARLGMVDEDRLVERGVSEETFVMATQEGAEALIEVGLSDLVLTVVEKPVRKSGRGVRKEKKSDEKKVLEKRSKVMPFGNILNSGNVSF